MALAMTCIALEVALPFLDGYLPIPQSVFAVLCGVFTVAGLYARVVVQKEFSDAPE